MIAESFSRGVSEPAVSFDVGPEGHGWAAADLSTSPMTVLACGWIVHEDALNELRALCEVGSRVALEEFHNLGRPIFRDGADTLTRGGELSGAWWASGGSESLSFGFPDVARFVYLSGATEAQVQRVIIESFPATGGGSTPQIGTKGQPGPLYALRQASYPPDYEGKRDHHKAALAALCYAQAFWRGEIR